MAAEVYFVDVGLGSCQIILLGNQRAIVIDCGVKSDHLALQFLKRFGILEIECLITSHSDNDHIGGAISILNDYQDMVKLIGVVQDHKFLNSRYWQRIDYLIEDSVLDEKQVIPLLLQECPKTLWRDGAKSSLKLFSPSFRENLRAQGAGAANATSAVLVLDHLGSRFVFAGDSVIAQWKKIHDRRKRRRLDCDVLAVPHHGGNVQDTADDLDWLYGDAIAAKFAIVSVGTRRNPSHPREEVVARLVANGSTVLCTEITSKCHSHVDSLRPGVLQPVSLFGRAFDAEQKGRNGPIACAGTVCANVTEDGVTIQSLNRHQAAVDKLARLAGGCPLCRK